jgi:uncharacterized protein YbjT (DUF2867 family)
MKILLFGATGSAGGSVLEACLATPRVDVVRAITRRPLKRDHSKLRVFVHSDFIDYTSVRDAFVNIDACLFCLGVSSTQVRGEQYRRITHDYTMAAARMVKQWSPAAAFHYITGKGTQIDSRLTWARVKGQTEKELIDVIHAVCWRPAFIDGADTGPRLFRAVRPVLRLLKPFKSLYVSGEDLGHAMLQSTIEDMRSEIIENEQIRELAVRFAR